MKLALAVLGGLLCSIAQTAGALTLEEAVALSQKRNERTEIAGETVAAADGRVQAARAFFLPSVNLTGTYTRRSQEVTREVGGVQTVIQIRDALQGTANLNFTIFDARSIPLYRQALRDRDSVALSAKDSVRLLGFDTANAFLQTLGAQQVLGAAERSLDLAQRTLEDARARFKAQLVRSNDVTKAELEAATAQQALIQARSDLENSRLQLGFLLVAPLADELIEPTELLAGALPGEATGLVSEAVKRRLDLAAGRRREESLRAFSDEPLMRFVPILGFLMQGRGTNEPGLSGRNFDWSLSLNLSWTLFDGGRAFGDRKERIAVAEVQRLTNDANTRAVDLAIRSALVDLGNAQAGITQAEVAFAAAKKNTDEVQALYKQGLSTALEVATANQQLFGAEVTGVRARYALGIAHLNLRAAVGLDALGKEP